MPTRGVLARELAEFLKVMAHPDRVRLIEELRSVTLDVTALSERLSVPPARVSQHLALLKSHRLVAEKRDGRRHQYSLMNRSLADWLLDGASFVQARLAVEMADSEALDAAASLWREQHPGNGSEAPHKPANGEDHG